MASLDEQARWISDSAAIYVAADRLLRVTGDDATSWLNGQVTNDVRALQKDAATYALAVTVKGRVISDLWARAGEAGPVLSIPLVTREALLASFDKHIIMEDVELAEQNDLCLVSVQGPKAREVIADESLVSFSCPRLHAEGVDLVVPEAERDALLSRLSARAEALGGGLLEAAGLAHAHVLGAVPRVGIDFGDTSYPQEAGLKGRAVSFNKGCYTGQEVVYMLENRGQLSRRLVQIAGPAEAPLKRGDSLFDSQGARVGEVTSASVTQGSPATTVGLAYLKRAAADLGSTVRAADTNYAVKFVVGVTNDPCPIIAP